MYNLHFSAISLRVSSINCIDQKAKTLLWLIINQCTVKTVKSYTGSIKQRNIFN